MQLQMKATCRIDEIKQDHDGYMTRTIPPRDLRFFRT